jgi:hypothetical protein
MMKIFACTKSKGRLAVLMWLLFTAPAWGADVSARLDRDRIVEGETVTLVLQTTDPQQTLDIDVSVLEPDFQLLDQRSETQMSIVNGRQSAVVRLLLTLEPKRSGRLTIPELNVSGETTPALQINVEPAPEAAEGDTPPVFIEVELEPADGYYYVHAQFGLTVRVYYQQNLTEAAISQPEPEPAAVRLLDEVPYQAERNGERYRVLERHYAIFPERSGALTIPPLKLSGRLVERRSDRLWQPTVRGRRIQVESEPVTLEVLPRPPSFLGTHWQPARRFNLSQQVSATDTLRVGEPVTRTIIIDAVGLEENMIAEPDWPEIANARIYPDQPQGISRDDGRWVLGHKEFRYAVVPEKAGELVLPELKIHWWDTVVNVAHTAVLPEKVLTVEPSALAPQSPQPAAGVDAMQPHAAAEPGQAAAPQAGLWRWLTLLFAVLWLATLALFFRGRGAESGGGGAGRSEQDARESELLSRLKKACNGNDPAAARRALSAWLNRFGPESASGSLLDFASGLETAELRGDVRALDSFGYKPGADSAWEGRALWRSFDEWRKAWVSAAAQRRASVTDIYAPENRALKAR